MTLTLAPYQIEARDFIAQHKRAGLFLDMGLGKTASTLAALGPDDLPALVVAPKRVAETTWPDEVDLWRPEWPCTVAAGTPAKRRAVLEAPQGVVTIGRDNLRDAVEHAESFKTFIVDESSGFKNYASKRFKAAKEIANVVDRVVILTGTPMPNDLMDLWAQIYLLDRGKRLGKNITAFRNRFFDKGQQLPNGVVIEWRPKPGAREHIFDAISDLVLAMDTAGRVDLPPVTHNTVPVPVPAKVRALYERYRKDAAVDLEILGGGVSTAPTAAALSNRLSQITAGAIYPDPDDPDPRDAYTEVHREKITVLQEIVDSSSSPIMVFYRYRFERDFVLSAFPKAGTPETPDFVTEWNNGNMPMLVSHPASVGHGLNLQHGGHIAVWLSPVWDSELWQQANKRLARRGQKHPVIIHRLVVPNTVDKAIYTSLTDKREGEKELLDHLELL